MWFLPVSQIICPQTVHLEVCMCVVRWLRLLLFHFQAIEFHCGCGFALSTTHLQTGHHQMFRLVVALLEWVSLLLPLQSGSQGRKDSHCSHCFQLLSFSGDPSVSGFAVVIVSGLLSSLVKDKQSQRGRGRSPLFSIASCECTYVQIQAQIDAGP